jgi:excisionase family DNA binding protein
MNLFERLRAIVAPLPPGSQVSLPVDWLRTALEDAPAALVPVGDSTPLTVEQIAERLGRSPSTVRGWLAEGCFPNAHKLRGRSWLIPAADLAAFLAGPSQPAQERDVEQGRGLGSDDLGSWRKHMRKAS